VASGRSNGNLDGFPRRYLAALRIHMGAVADPEPGPAGRLGLRACELGIETLALARIHGDALAAMLTPAGRPGRRRGRARRAASFFAEAMGPIEAAHRPAVEALAERKRMGRSIERGVVDLATANRRFSRESGRRRVAQEALELSDGKHRALLKRSVTMAAELRQLSRSLLTSHEEERRRISRELHDALGQTLTAVNVGLASLKATSLIDSKDYRVNVSRTQRLVQKSMRTVHRFARDLRPTLLDDLGLVPALLAFSREFGRKNRLKVALSAAAGAGELDGDGRTALFRVAQEALVNVGRHAGARNVRVSLRRTPKGVRLDIWNDGASFDVARAMASKANRHLGLLCMRERMEMVGGVFSIQSSKKGGTLVQAEVPVAESPRA
jgi:signal transduction histidine kinase